MTAPFVTIFGGSGFLGRHLVRHLAPSGATLRIAVRDPEDAKFLKPLGDVGRIVPVKADIGNEREVVEAIAGADAVVNLVGILHQWGRRTFQAVHVLGAERIARGARTAGCARLVHVSALGAEARSQSAYARTKAAGEEAVRAAFPGATVVRPAVVFGPEDQFFNRFAAMARLSRGLPVFFKGWPRVDLFADFPFPRVVFHAGVNRMQPVYVGDVARALSRFVLEPGFEGKTFELGGPAVYTMAELMRLVLRFSGLKRPIIPVPFFAAYAAAFFLEKLPFAPLTRDQLKLLERDNVVSEGALGFKDLDIVPTAIELAVPPYLGRFGRPRPGGLKPLLG